MSTDTIRTDQPHREQSSTSVATGTTETLASIVAIVKHDCQQDAGTYLQETEVPHGGE